LSTNNGEHNAYEALSLCGQTKYDFMASKLIMEEVKRVISKKELPGTGSRTDRTGLARRTKKISRGATSCD
jgi:hypothetical protein